MLYLLDANILIDANQYYYPIERIPEFWEWLVDKGTTGVLKVPQEIYDEILYPSQSNQDPVIVWLRTHRPELLLNETVLTNLVARVVDEGYANDLTDEEVDKIGNDPFLIAYGLVDTTTRCVVSNERSRPTRTRANRHVPDVCDQFDLPCINIFKLIRDMDFRTDWRTRP